MFDIVGVAVLVILILIFAFLTSRAWKSKRRLLKWVGTILSGLLALIMTGLLILALIGYSKLNQHYDNPIADIQVAGTEGEIARGEKLANICASCHTPVNELPLSGSNFGKKFGMPPLGPLYAPNLTPSGNIADWTDGEVIRAIREGVDKDGRSLLVMPSNDLQYMSDEDVQAIVAYLRSQPATGEPTPETHFNLLGAIFTNLVDFRTAQQPVGHVMAPPLADPSAYGKYLVDVIGCRDCHGSQLEGRVENGQPGPTPGPNLTKIVSQWTEADFMTFFNTGIRPDGSEVPLITLPSGFSEPRMPWPMVRAALTDEELEAIYTYLHNLPPVEGPTQ
ncbi:MAG: cytochrome c [Candidatus Promineifilaceae bacterium]